MINFLQKTGLNKIYKIEDFVKTEITLRDGRQAYLWVNKKDGFLGKVRILL
jgi:hypothetical protein